MMNDEGNLEKLATIIKGISKYKQELLALGHSSLFFSLSNSIHSGLHNLFKFFLHVDK